MAWIAVNKSNCEKIFHNKPSRVDGLYWEDKETYWDIRGVTTDACDYSIILPMGSIEKLIGRKLTWDDDPVEI